MRRLLGLLAAGAALSAGCDGGPALAPVGGRVTYPDGSPATAGVVEFEPVGGGPTARGVLDKSGAYSLATNDRPGAVPGEYRVVVLQAAVIDGIAAGGAHHKHAGKFVHPKHRRFDTSGLTATVVAGTTNDIPIRVEPTPK